MSRKQISPVLLVLAAVIILAVIFGGWYVSARNSLVRLEQQVEGTWSEVDNQLQRRYDLIPNLVETVRGYAAHEQEVFQAVADARSRIGSAQGVEDTAAAANQMESALSRLLVVVEAYPELRADQSFIRLQDELAGTENRLAVARRRYNETVMRFNQEIRVFPKNMVAGNMGMTQKSYFEIQEAARSAPQVQF